jgi:hypothetical protein
MKVVLSGPNDENLDLHRSADDYFQPTLAPRPAIASNVEMEVPTEPGPAELEYIVSDDLKDLADVDTQVMVKYLALLFSISTLVKAGQMHLQEILCKCRSISNGALCIDFLSFERSGKSAVVFITVQQCTSPSWFVRTSFQFYVFFTNNISF